MKRVRVGISGCGVMGGWHAAAAAAADSIELAAVADPVAERARELAGKHRVPGVYGDGRDLIDDEAIDAVVLALPTGLRGPLALAAFERGKHVLVEKPAAMSVEELEGLIAARGSLVAGSCSSRYRFLPSAAAVTDFLRSAPMGPIRSIFIRDFATAKPRPDKEKPAWRLKKDLNGGGIFVNWGCYDLDYVLGVAGWGVEPRQVSAQTWTISPLLASHVPAGSDAETHVVAFVRCAGGAVIHYERAEYIPLHTPACAWEIIGERGALRLTMRPGTGKQIHYDELDAEQGASSRVIWEGDEDGSIIHGRPVQDFAEAIVEGRSPATTLEQALVLQKITDAVYASAESGETVAIP